jgi:hypothetical protein
VAALPASKQERCTREARSDEWRSILARRFDHRRERSFAHMRRTGELNCGAHSDPLA